MKFKCPACKEIIILKNRKKKIKSYCALKEKDVYLIKLGNGKNREEGKI